MHAHNENKNRQSGHLILCSTHSLAYSFFLLAIEPQNPSLGSHFDSAQLLFGLLFAFS
jgi:hypothetical protein